MKPSVWNKGVSWNPIPYDKQDAWAQYDTRKKREKQWMVFQEYLEDRKKRKKAALAAGTEDDLSASEDEHGHFKTGYEQTDFMKVYSSAIDEDKEYNP